jgi:hypothetical protein
LRDVGHGFSSVGQIANLSNRNLAISVNHRFHRHCEEGALPDEAISSPQEGIASRKALAMTVTKDIQVKP